MLLIGAFRDHNIKEFVDDDGNKKELECNERYYVPCEITWLLKTLPAIRHHSPTLYDIDIKCLLNYSHGTTGSRRQRITPLGNGQSAIRISFFLYLAYKLKYYV